MITRILIVVGLVLSSSLCLAEGLPERTEEIKSLTVEQAADLNKGVQYLDLDGLISINKDVAHELAKFSGYQLHLGKLSLIDNDVALELGKSQCQELYLDGLTSIDNDVAQELAKSKGWHLGLYGLTSIDKDVAQKLGKSKVKNLHLSAKALQTYQEVNGESPSVMAGGMF